MTWHNLKHICLSLQDSEWDEFARKTSPYFPGMSYHIRGMLIYVNVDFIIRTKWGPGILHQVSQSIVSHRFTTITNMYIRYTQYHIYCICIWGTDITLDLVGYFPQYYYPKLSKMNHACFLSLSPNFLTIVRLPSIDYVV